MTTLHDFEATTIDGDTVPMADYSGKALLIVNVASQCGLTPHYKGLQALHQTYASKGFAVLGFPCNQFGAQEPGSEGDIKEFCSSKFSVSFPMFAKVEVNGAGKHPLFGYLTSQDTQPDPAGDIAWNFAKFVVDGAGQVTARFSPPVEPGADELKAAIEAALPG